VPFYLWFGTAANSITTVIAVALFLLVFWLGPRRRVNLSFCLFLLALMVWTGSSLPLRLALALNIGDPEMCLRIATVGFGAVGVTLFTFAVSFYETKSSAVNALIILGFLLQALFSYLIITGQVITAPVLLADGIVMYTVTLIGRLSSIHLFFYNLLALVFLVRQRYQKGGYLLIGTALIFIGNLMGAFNLSPIPFLTINCAIGSLIMAYAILKFQLFNPLLELNRELEARVEARTAELAASLREQERIKGELTIARQIQLSLLPQSHPWSSVFDIYGCSIPAEEVGGDFYSYQRLRDGRLGIVVGDVSGKGVPAAILMAVSTSVAEACATTHGDGDVSHLLADLNKTLFPRLQASGMNTALLYVLLDEQSRGLNICNAGLIYPLLRRGTRAKFLEAAGLPLGVLEDNQYNSLSITLNPGESLLLLSDGVVEAHNSAGEMFGLPRLEGLVSDCSAQQSAQEFVNVILGTVQAFISPVSAQDDMTLVVVKAREEVRFPVTPM
jgi:serine phosphatase RsbU (regulator of sigma subunit)